MTIHITSKNLHWNYLISLEKDLEVISRYIEFDEKNFEVFSIELAQLLFAASSEVDVVAKLLCENLRPGYRVERINEYRDVILNYIPDLPDYAISIPRHGMNFKPWQNWGLEERKSPDWWRSYNNVKHQRDIHFHEATLKNALNSLGALLILTAHLHARKLDLSLEQHSIKHALGELEPKTTLMYLDGDFYYSNLVC